MNMKINMNIKSYEHDEDGNGDADATPEVFPLTFVCFEGGATSTRQNPNGNGRRRGNQRHGLECPEDSQAFKRLSSQIPPKLTKDSCNTKDCYKFRCII